MPSAIQNAGFLNQAFHQIYSPQLPIWFLDSQINYILKKRYLWSLYLRMFRGGGGGGGCKNYLPVSLLSVVSKVFEKLVNNRIVDHLEKSGFFLISSMVLGVLDQLKTFSQLYLIELLGLLTGLGLELWHLIYQRLLIGFDMLVFFTNLRLIEFQDRCLSLSLLFSVIDGLEWFWMASPHRNIQLMLEFLKVPFLVLHFSYSTLMNFLTMLSVILLSILMILLYILGVIRHLICGNNLNWLLNLNLIYETLWTGVKSGLLISIRGKLNWFHLTGLITGSTDVKMDGSVLEKKSSFGVDLLF